MNKVYVKYGEEDNPQYQRLGADWPVRCKGKLLLAEGAPEGTEIEFFWGDWKKAKVVYSKPVSMVVEIYSYEDPVELKARLKKTITKEWYRYGNGENTLEVK